MVGLNDPEERKPRVTEEGLNSANEWRMFERIIVRESLMQKLVKLVNAYKMGRRWRLSTFFTLMVKIRKATIAVVDAIYMWRIAFTRRLPCKFVGTNYVIHMIDDMDFLRTFPTVELLGYEVGNWNPMSLPLAASSRELDPLITQRKLSKITRHAYVGFDENTIHKILEFVRPDEAEMLRLSMCHGFFQEELVLFAPLKKKYEWGYNRFVRDPWRPSMSLLLDIAMRNPTLKCTRGALHAKTAKLIADAAAARMVPEPEPEPEPETEEQKAQNLMDKLQQGLISTEDVSASMIARLAVAAPPAGAEEQPTADGSQAGPETNEASVSAPASASASGSASGSASAPRGKSAVDPAEQPSRLRSRMHDNDGDGSVSAVSGTDVEEAATDDAKSKQRKRRRRKRRKRKRKNKSKTKPGKVGWQEPPEKPLPKRCPAILLKMIEEERALRASVHRLYEKTPGVPRTQQILDTLLPPESVEDGSQDDGAQKESVAARKAKELGHTSFDFEAGGGMTLDELPFAGARARSRRSARGRRARSRSRSRGRRTQRRRSSMALESDASGTDASPSPMDPRRVYSRTQSAIGSADARVTSSRQQRRLAKVAERAEVGRLRRDTAGGAIHRPPSSGGVIGSPPASRQSAISSRGADALDLSTPPGSGSRSPMRSPTRSPIGRSMTFAAFGSTDRSMVSPTRGRSAGTADAAERKRKKRQQERKEREEREEEEAFLQGVPEGNELSLESAPKSESEQTPESAPTHTAAQAQTPPTKTQPAKPQSGEKPKRATSPSKKSAKRKKKKAKARAGTGSDTDGTTSPGFHSTRPRMSRAALERSRQAKREEQLAKDREAITEDDGSEEHEATLTLTSPVRRSRPQSPPRSHTRKKKQQQQSNT